MNPDLWNRAEELYHAAMERPAGERADFVARESAGDGELRREVESLLAHEGEADSLLEDGPWKGLAAGSAIGAYRIVSKLGQGGMGEVFRATDTRLRREVALKVVAREFAEDAAWLSRFQREARVLASLNHPNIAAIYGLEESGGQCAIAMELVEGVSLAERMAKGRIPVVEALHIARQMADALEYAHEAGIVHRDLKPANVRLRRDGVVKVLDFGLAKTVGSKDSLVEPATRTGVVMGTPAYMPPEQANGKQVDRRADIWSFGVVLFEMLSGRPVYARESTVATLAAVTRDDPRWKDLPAETPAGVVKLLRRCLEKDPEKRLGNIAEARTAIEKAGAPRRSASAWTAWAAPIVLIVAIAGWQVHKRYRQEWARGTAAAEAARLIESGEDVKAAALLREARSVLPRDPGLERLWMRATGEVSFATEPAGAELAIRPYNGDPNRWQPLGKTPITVRLPHEFYVWRLTKTGYAPIWYVARPPDIPPPGAHLGLVISWKLRPAPNVPTDMVVVPGTVVSLGYPFAYAPRGQVGDFLIDRNEVTNEQYKRFVDAGGYQRREFWKQPFVKEGRSISWEEAVTQFRDSTGRPGPSTWEAGGYPKGRENHPVAGVSWFEAAAYAEFAGKSLPTAYHWSRASESYATDSIALMCRGSNFSADGTRSVGSPGGLSGFGTADMAGNVKEWCWNETGDGRRLIMGGGFGEPEYTFYQPDAQSPWDRRSNFGFRCAKLDGPPSASSAARIEVHVRDYWHEKPVSDEVFRAYAALYAYDKTDLNARVEEAAATKHWSRVKVSFDAAYGGERVIAYLFIPAKPAPPLQTIVFFPGAYSFTDTRLDLSAIEDNFDFFLNSGRALVFPIYKGTYERRDGLIPGDNSRAAFRRDHEIAWAKDLSRTLDYLETRPDFDISKVAYAGSSNGALEGVHLLAIEKRIKAAILMSGGLNLTLKYLPEADPFNFVSRVTVPVLMLNGRYDMTYPLESSQEPMFQFFGTPAGDKKHVIYDGGHGVFPRPDAVRECLDWLDKYLGRTRQ